MSSSRDAAQELEELLMALVDGQLSPAQGRRLAELLRDNPTGQKQYRAYLLLDALLSWEQTDAVIPPPVPQPVRWLSWPRAALLMAASLLLVMGGFHLHWWLQWPGSTQVAGRPTPVNSAEPTDDGVAVLVQAPGADWDETGAPPRPGDSLPVGRLRLKSGLAQIQFYSGATVILEGPADFHLVSSQEAYCERGKLRALVPPQAQGFTIRSPQWALVDRGTEFGLEVDGGGKTEVHVFQGKVELYEAGLPRPPAPRQELTGGRGLRLETPGTSRPIISNSAGFPTAWSLAKLSQDEASRRLRRWHEASAALRQDPRLLVYYPFETDEPWGCTLLDQAQVRHQPHDGAIVGCEWVAGRWPKKQALEFKRPSDRVRISVPGKYPALTLMGWVRIDGLDREYNGLLLSDDWPQGAMPHWQIGQKGELRLGVNANSGRFVDSFASPVVFSATTLGQWTHLTTVWDERTAAVKHYVDGRCVSSHLIHYPSPLSIGSADIGNWKTPPAGARVPIRNLNGRIDEFAVFREALNEREIQQLYEAGRP